MEKKIDLRVALFGNPNSGKTTIFNALTGSHQHVGNWSGVTVDSKLGMLKGVKERVELVDLPGAYSLTPNSPDEVVVRDALMSGTFDCIVCIIDANNVERNLYPMIQLLEFSDKPVILVLNMMDEVESTGHFFDIEKIAEALRVKVIPAAAIDGRGIPELREAIVSPPEGNDFKLLYDTTIERQICRILRLKSFEADHEDAHWTALKVLERDPQVMKSLKSKPYFSDLRKIQNSSDRDLGRPSPVHIGEYRHGLIRGLVAESIKHTEKKTDSIEFADAFDHVITNPWVGIPLFIVIIFLIFQLVFKLGSPLQEMIGGFFSWSSIHITQFFASISTPAWLASLIVNGLIAGVGGVLSFLPNIMILFFLMSYLEDTGYMARAAFVMDGVMHKMGLHGKSFIPMILGFGCNVPAIMAARTLETRKDRILTVLVNPFMSCSARLPIYVLFASAFFTKHQGFIVFSIYMIGIIIAVFSARLFKKLFFKEEDIPLIIELPPFRMPKLVNSILHMWLKARSFIYKAGTVIVAGVVIVWFLSSVPFGVEYASEESFLGVIGRAIAPVFHPAGLGDWKIVVALVFGIIAKEEVVAILATLLPTAGQTLSEALHLYFTPVTAFGFMILTLVYTPCFATLGVMKKEIGLKWTMFSVFYGLLLGWVLATLINIIFS
ncbi:ferrous iron transport protein B [bacterium]|nr:ferrous iron transport protein B [bacterium]